jgi:ketosteroid isomerase-like protein
VGTDTERREANQRVLERLFDRLNAGDYDGVLELVAEDVAWEMPFSPPALPAPFNRQRFGKVLRTWPTVFSDGFTFDEVTIHPMLDPDRLVVEFRGDARMAATGKRYRNRYVGLFHVVDGQIRHAREYFDSAVAILAFGWPPDQAADHDVPLGAGPGPRPG